MTDYEETIQGPDFRDRKAWLVVFGIIQIIFGGICTLLVPLMILGMIMATAFEDSSTTPMNISMMIPGILFYVMLAVWFIFMGIGSIKARRWARALLLVSSWVWLISGISGLIFMLLLMPDMYDQMAKGEQMPEEAVLIMKYVITVFMIIFYVIIPGVFVLFYGSKNVKATCEFRDPHVRWTDKRPLPVLAVSLLFGVWAFMMLFMGFHGWTIPFFGFILSGMAGAGVTLVVMLLLAYVAWGTYKLNIKAWWCSVLVIIAWSLSMGITFSRVSIWDFYEKMNFPEQQLEIMKQVGMPQSSTMALFTGLWVLGFLGFLLYTRRYFTLPSEQESTS